MIIVNLKGGLGNQMFQYACGRALSLRTQNKLKLDAESYFRIGGSDIHRPYRLPFFNTLHDRATPEEIRKLKYPLGPISKGWRYFKTKVLRQFNTHFMPKILRLQGDVYLDGFWQSEQYFMDFEDQIRADFTLKEPMKGVAKDSYDRISRDPYAVALHVRRGDYVNQAAGTFGGFDMTYYERALAEIAKVMPKPNVYVFSDDVEWVQDNLRFPYPMHIVTFQDIPDYHAVVLMSACKHNIIANSSFSWWGAWLNSNKNKVVIAPKKWANKEEWQYRDIIPKKWIRM